MPRLECFFDCSSPWTYLCFHNLPAIAERAGVPIEWRPFLVGGVFNAVNPSVYASREQPVPAKQAHLKKSLADWARLAGLTIVFPPTVFPVNSVTAMRACLVAQDRGALVPFARAVFEAYWRDDRDIAQREVLADCATAAGLDATGLLEQAATPACRDRLRSATSEAIARGAFGSPTMFVDGDDMYFGNDALPLVAAALARRR